MGHRHFRDVLRDSNPEVDFDEDEITKVAGAANVQDAIARRVDDLSAGFLHMMIVIRSHGKKLDDMANLRCASHEAHVELLKQHGNLLEDLAQQSRESYESLQRTIRHAAAREERLKALEGGMKDRRSHILAVWLTLLTFGLGSVGGLAKILWDGSQLAAVVSSNRAALAEEQVARSKLLDRHIELKGVVAEHSRSLVDQDTRLTMVESASQEVVKEVSELRNHRGRARR